MQVTSTDIAERAGVSRATVSYVLNNNPKQSISDSTRDAVLRAAKDLGYRPNVAARSLRSGRGSSVLFPLPGLQEAAVASHLALACQRSLEAVGLALVVDYSAYATVDGQLDAWLKHSPAAVIDLLLRHDDPVLDALRARGTRVLSAGLSSDNSWESTSDAFARQCRLTQVGHLLDRGADHIAVVLPPALATDPRAQRRLLKEWRDLAKVHGSKLTIWRSRLEPRAIRKLIHGWSGPGAPDGVAAFNDEYAIAVMTALISAGRKVPDDVQIVGVDDLALGSVITPTLSTVGADFDEYAHALASAVLLSLEGGGSAPPMPTPTHRLIARESTRSPTG